MKRTEKGKPTLSRAAALDRLGPVEDFLGGQDKRRIALDQASDVAAQFVENRHRQADSGDVEAREVYTTRYRRSDLERLRLLAFEERGEGGRTRSIQGLFDEALELLFASREIDLEPTGFKGPHGYRLAALALMAKKQKKS